MSSIYTPSAIVHGSYVLPSDGDPAVAESVNDALRDLADGVLNANTNASAAVALANQMVNGVTGGSYAPTSDIEISGANGGGFVVDGNMVHEGGTFTIRDDGIFIVNGLSTFVGSVTVTGTANFTDTVDIQTLGAITASIRNLSISGDTSVGNSAADTFVVEATSTFNQPVTFNGLSAFAGIATFQENAVFNNDVILGDGLGDSIDCRGQLFIHSRLRYADTGYVPYRAPVLLPNSSATISIEDSDVFVVRPGITGTCNYNLSNAGAVGGSRMIFMTANSQGMSNNANINGLGFESVTFAAGPERGWHARFIYLTDMADRADGWWLESFGHNP